MGVYERGHSNVVMLKITEKFADRITGYHKSPDVWDDQDRILIGKRISSFLRYQESTDVTTMELRKKHAAHQKLVKEHEEKEALEKARKQADEEEAKRKKDEEEKKEGTEKE